MQSYFITLTVLVVPTSVLLHGLSLFRKGKCYCSTSIPYFYVVLTWVQKLWKFKDFGCVLLFLTPWYMKHRSLPVYLFSTLSLALQVKLPQLFLCPQLLQLYLCLILMLRLEKSYGNDAFSFLVQVSVHYYFRFTVEFLLYL
jgi:hypothetical protein